MPENSYTKGILKESGFGVRKLTMSGGFGRVKDWKPQVEAWKMALW